VVNAHAKSGPVRDGYLLALDAGIGGGRSLIFAPDGRLIAWGYQEWTAQAVPGVPGGLAFDPEHYWTALSAATRSALETSEIPPDRIRAISVTCQREGFLLLDAADRPLYAGPSADIRGAQANAELATRHGAALYHVTGHVPDAFHMPGRLQWLRQHQPDVFARARRLMMINDWMLFRLCGAWVGEPSNACSSALFDVPAATWSDQAIDLAGLPRDIFPPIVASGTRVGELHRTAAAETGLAIGTPVVVGGGDGQCGLLGAGATDPGDVAAIAGTTTPMLMHLTQPLFDPLRRTWTRSGLEKERWALEANAGITGLAFRWVRDLLYETPSEDSYQKMVRLAEGAPLGTPGTRSLLGPKPMATRWWSGVAVSGQLAGIGPFAGHRAEIIRATMESICYAVRANCELLSEVTKQPITALRLVGGQSRSPTWVQMQADILGMPVLLPSVHEASGWGAALCAGVGVGYWSSVSDAARVSIDHESVEPRAVASRLYNDLYPDWLRDIAASE
jgi:autoinducer 2 (AI-2) kinase